MSFRYIGSKTRIVDRIIGLIGKSDGGTFVDGFAGTGAVAEAASEAGWAVHVNDHLACSAIMAFARVTSEETAPFLKFGGYENAIVNLNAVKPLQGIIWREYSPASDRHCAVTRMYFTEDNARRIDGFRLAIRRWRQHNMLNQTEEWILIADLMKAANRVANTAGTYGCFLSTWQRQSLDSVAVEPRRIPRPIARTKMTIRDVVDLKCNPEDTVYLDPPYTKRQYAAYYHILQTIALGDEPKVSGVCGIRPWRRMASDYCYKERAGKALERLVAGLGARRIFMSYSTEGQVSVTTLYEIFRRLGNVVMHKIDEIGRYRPNQAASQARSHVSEILFEIEKEKCTKMEVT